MSYFISLGFNLTSISDQSFLRNIGLAETAAVTGSQRKKIITDWLNLEENEYVIDAETIDLVSQPISLNLNSPSQPLIMDNSNSICSQCQGGIGNSP